MNTIPVDAERPRVMLQIIATLKSTMPHVSERFLVPSLLAIFLTPFLVLVFYSSPATDDYCKAALSYNAVRQPGVLAITWMYYMKWTPRTLTIFLQSLAMSSINLTSGYGWLLLCVITINIAALWYFFRTVFRLARTRSLVVAAVFYAAWVASITQPEQAIYWLTGATEYNLSLSALLVLVSLLYRPHHSIRYYGALTVLSLAIPALHELAGTFLCMILLTAAVFARFKKFLAPQVYVSLGLAALSQAIMMLSPGIAVRAAFEHRTLWNVGHFPMSVAHALYHGITWMRAPAVLVGTCCIFLLVQDQQAREPQFLPPRWFGIGGLIGMFLILCQVALVEAATSTCLMPYVVTWFEFLFWLLFVCTALSGAPEIYQVRFSSRTRIGMSVLLSVLLLGSSNFKAAVEDVQSGSARSWWYMNASRLQQRGDSLEFQAPSRYPKLAMRQQLTANPECWVNRCMATYLGAKKVVVKDSTESCP